MSQIVKRRHKIVNLHDKKWQTSIKKSQTCEFSWQKSKHSEKKSQKCKFKW